MTRVLTSGWENRCMHPQFLSSMFEINYQGEETYPAGGVEGIGMMQQSYQSIVNDEFHRAVMMYSLLDDDSHMYMNVDMRIATASSYTWKVHWQTRIYWDGVPSDPGYIAFDSFENKIYWEWSGHSGVINKFLQHGQWYNIDLHIYANPAGNSIIQLKIDGFDELTISEAIPCAFSEISEIGLGFYDHDGFPEVEACAHQWDNLKVNNSLGPAPDNTWPWHLVMIGLPITGDGAITQLMAYPGPPNFENIDELTPNDADYNTSDETLKMDTYIFDNCPILVLGSPSWAPTRFILRERHMVAVPTGEGWTPGVRIGGFNFMGTPQVSGSAFKCFEQIWTTNPATGMAWEKNIINAMEVIAETHD